MFRQTSKLLLLYFFLLPAHSHPLNKISTQSKTYKKYNSHPPSTSNKESKFNMKELETLTKALSEEKNLKLQIWSWPRNLNSVIPIKEDVLKENNYGHIQVTKHNLIMGVLNELTNRIELSDLASSNIQKYGLNTTEVLFEFYGSNDKLLFSVSLDKGLEIGKGSYLQFKIVNSSIDHDKNSPIFYVNNFDQLIELVRILNQPGE